MLLTYRSFILKLPLRKYASVVAQNASDVQNTVINNRKFVRDEWSNINPQIISHIGKSLYLQKCHPLSLIRQRIVNYFYKKFVGRTGNAIFSVFDSLNPVVSIKENFDSLLIPQDHPSRKKSDCYYINHDFLLRAHMTAHQAELIGMGLNNFLIIGDVYRRDEIDSSHYPVFHQIDAVRLCTAQDVMRLNPDGNELNIFENRGLRTEKKQEIHTLEATLLMEHELKTTLEGLTKTLFGGDVQLQWVEAYFPFTHPSWELEVFHQGQWLEVLGCGIMEHKILEKAGAQGRIGWAFGLGLERLAMRLFDIPDIRLFWSTDSGFLSQFNTEDINMEIKYKPISVHPQCFNDISFWLPTSTVYSSNDFYDLVRNVGGDVVEQISLVEEYVHPKKGLTSHCYRIVYRHMEKTLTQEEVNSVHKKIEHAAASELNVTVR